MFTQQELGRAVFLHCWIPDDPISQLWPWWIDYYLNALLASGLGYKSDVSVHISMPQHREIDYAGNVYRMNGQPALFSHVVENYIRRRYKFVRAIFIRDTTHENMYEGFTLNSMWNWCQNKPNEKVLYIHTKGVRSPQPEIRVWVDTMLQDLVYDWEGSSAWLDPSEDSQEYDVVACKEERNVNEPLVSGNFFWANSNYIKGLEEPTSFQVPHEAYDGNERYKYERWITSGEPSMKCVRWFTTDPYVNYVA